MFADLIADLRYALRLCRKGPGFTSVAVLSLALGIGANTAIFSLMDALMLRPLPVADAEQLILAEAPPTDVLSYGRFEQLRERANGRVALSAVLHTDRYNVGIGSPATIDPGPVRAALVSADYFATVGVRPAIGRLPAVDAPADGAAWAVVSDDYWRRAFASAPDVLGRPLVVNNVAYEIAAVAPRGFHGEWIGRPADVWLPIVRQSEILVEIPQRLPAIAVSVMGRLQHGATIAEARSLLETTWSQTLRDEEGATVTRERLQQIASQRLSVTPAARGISPQRSVFGVSVSALMGAVAIVLLIACANLANLLLARSAARQRELAVRLAIGAGRARLARQLLTESVLLASAGGAIGLLFAQWATSLLAGFVRGGPVGNAVTLSMDLDVHPDVRVLAFTAALCMLTGVLFGLVPALRASSVDTSRTLTGRGADSHATGRLRPGKLLVVMQVALSIVVLVAAGLFMRTLHNLSTRELGFARDRVLLVWTLPGQTAGRGVAAADFWRTTLDRLASLPGVTSVSASNQGVLNGSDLSSLGRGTALRVEGEPPRPYGLPSFRSFVAPGFFKTLGIPIVEGRDFTERDTESAPRVAIISQTMARDYFGGRSAIGRRIWFPEDTSAPTEIVGVAGDFTSGTPREVERRHPTYFSYRDREAARRLRNMMFAVRTTGDPTDTAGRIRETLREAAPNLPVLRINTVEQQLNDVLVQERLIATLSAFFGTLALLLACLGLYGVVSYSVTRRTNEIGIRLALGATPAAVRKAILVEGLALVAAGAALGAPAAVAGTHLVSSRLFGVSAADPWTLAGAIVVLVGVAALAGFVPARRASRVDPMIALRSE